MKKLRVLVGCEESQAVCLAFRALGHEAYSCDILPCSGGHPEWHFQQDIFEVINQGWDMMIAFPPCTHLAVSGAAWFEEKRKDGRQKEGIDIFLALANSDIPRIAIENPVGIMSSEYRKPDQVIQPWMFGHPEQKATCLWLKNLPKLKWTKQDNLFEKKTSAHEEMITLPENQRQRLHYLPPGPDRAKLRSKTFPGIARAMAEQWSEYLTR